MVKLFKVRLILEHRGQLLMLKQTTQNGGKYTLVGGNVEAGEFPLGALIRESKEEAGITLKPKDLQLVHTLFKRKDKDVRIVMYFKALQWQGTIRALEKNKFKTTAWFPLKKLPKNTSTTVKYVLKQYLNKITYSELER